MHISNESQNYKLRHTKGESVFDAFNITTFNLKQFERVKLIRFLYRDVSRFYLILFPPIMCLPFTNRTKHPSSPIQEIISVVNVRLPVT
jgi:hypothetical protein